MKDISTILTNIYTTLVEFFTSVVNAVKELFAGAKALAPTEAETEQA
ncbi:MAG: hypothetical protein ACI4GY_09495 [Acutalibacteraceae bacterium]